MAVDPIDPKLKTVMNRLAETLNSLIAPRRFVLLVFDTQTNPDYGEKRVNYIGNANRTSMLAALREFLAKHEGQQPMQQVADTLPLVIPEDIAPGTPMALQFTWEPDGIQQMELLEWKEEDHEVRA